MKTIFNKRISTILTIGMMIGILLGITFSVNAEVTVTHRIIANGSNFQVWEGASGGSQVGEDQATFVDAINIAITDGGDIIQFGDGTNALYVPTATSSTTNSLPSATYTGKVVSSGNNQYVLAITDGAQVTFTDIHITNTSAYTSYGNYAEAIYVSGATSKVTIDGSATQITVSSTVTNATGVYVASGTADINAGTITAGSYAVRNNGGIVNLSGGTIISTASNGYTIACFTGGTTNITGGTVGLGSANTTGQAIYFGSTGTLNISGGSFTAPDANTNTTAIKSTGTGTINISGTAVISSARKTIYNSGAGTINISGGTVQQTDPSSGKAIQTSKGTINVNASGKVISKSSSAITLLSVTDDDTFTVEVYGVTVWNKKGAEINLTGIDNAGTGFKEISSASGDYGVDKATLHASYIVSPYGFKKFTTTAARDTAVTNSSNPMTVGTNTVFYLDIGLTAPVISSGQFVKQGGTLSLTPISNMTNLKLQISKDDTTFTDLTYTANQSTVQLPGTLDEGTYRLYKYYTTDSVRSEGSTDTFTVDHTPPILTAGEVNRTSDTEGTVKFTSNEDGQYYYSIVSDGNPEPTINTDGTGTVLTAGETTITNPTGLTEGAKDIYIQVKDTAGNVSIALKIDMIPLATTPEGHATINNGTIKKNAEITLSSEAGATIYYTTALNAATPDEPTTSTPTQVSNGGVITLPALTYGDVLKIKAIAVVSGKPDSNVADISYTVQSQTALILTGVTPSDKEYDGNTDATANFTSAGLSGVIGTDSVTLTGTPSASFITATAGNVKTVTVSGYSLSGTDSEYYTLNTTLTQTANITKKPLTLGTIVIEDKIYDGNTDATVTSISIDSGIVGSDDVSVNVPLATATYDVDANIGTGKTVSVSNIQLTGVDSANYSVSATGTAVGNITARTVSIDSVTIADKAYDGNTTATITSVTLTGKVDGEDVAVDYTTTPAVATFADALVGHGKQVSVTGLVLGGSDKTNYTLASGDYTTTGNITSLGAVTTPTADIADYTVIKKGTAVTLTTAGNPGATLYYTVGVGVAPENPTSADNDIINGETVTITGNPGDIVILKVYGTEAGYADSSIATLHYTIQPKSTLTVTGAGAASKDYDGTTDAEVTGGTLAGSITTGDDVTLMTSAVVGQFEDKNTGSNKSVTVSGYALEGTDAMYYDLMQPTLTADIEKKNIAVSNIVISDKVYDGSAAATISSITLSWKAAGDEVYVKITEATAVFSDANIGNNKNVTVTGLELGGADANNYQLISATGSTIGNIVPAGMVASPKVNPIEESIFSGTKVTLTTATNGATIYYTLDGSEPTTDSNKFNRSISLIGDPGTVVTVKAIAVKVGMIDSGITTKQYIIAEPGSFIITAEPADQSVILSWNEIPDTVTYAVYSGDHYLGNGISVTDSVYGYNATGLTNGTLYTFTVNALDSEQRVTDDAQVSATPRTVPAAPTDVTAIEGNGQAIISFTAPTDNGGSEITGYIVTSSPGNITGSAMDSPITVTGLTNGMTYTFTVQAVNAIGSGPSSATSNMVRPHKKSSKSRSDETETPTTPTEETGVDVLINGKEETAATASITEIEDKIVTTIILDDKKIKDILENESNNAVVTVPFNGNADVEVCQLNGQTVKNMAIKEAVLEIKTEGVTYTLPATEINIDNVLAELGGQVELKDIIINISMAESPQETAKIVEDTANKNNYQIVVNPIEFNITCTSGEKSIEVSKFKRYIERTIAIPEGIDPQKITTGVVVYENGTLSHVPTKIAEKDGKYYAIINSLTNSTYSIIWSPKSFKDVENHWAKETINDMGSRLIINGIDEENFAPDKEISRGEFATIIVKGLGLMRTGTGREIYDDVKKTDWYYDAVYIANEYGLIKGTGNNRFEPNRKITREEAMTIMARAMALAKMNTQISEEEIEKQLEGYKDSNKINEWAKKSVAISIKNGIIIGNGKNIRAEDIITRAEVMVIVRRMLQKSNLIGE